MGKGWKCSDNLGNKTLREHLKYIRNILEKSWYSKDFLGFLKKSEKKKTNKTNNNSG